MAEEAHTDETEDSAPTTEEEAIEVPDDFDPERAMRTIKAQRESEEALKKELAEFRKEREEREAAEAEAQKTLEQKLADREARIAELVAHQAEKDVRADFIAKAVERGVKDPKLAYLAAKEEGLLGEADPKTGVVSDHNFEALGERFPTFATADEDEEETGGFGGDAGVRGKRTKRTPGSVFNESIRGTIQGL